MTAARWKDVTVFALLVAIGVAGRLGQPDWCMTPLAAVGIAAGWWFRSSLVAAAAPLSAMLLSDLYLPSYGHLGVAAVVYAALVWPVLLGKWIGRSERVTQAVVRWTTGAVAPALVFFVTVNFAVWLWSSYYQPTFAGLVQCYTAALPFLAKMLVGDLFYVGALAATVTLVAWAPSPSDPAKSQIG
jgi:hypothetical protein